MKPKPPIAIVGMAGVFPGASDLDIFWNNIVNKTDTTREVPENRWIVKPDAMYHPTPMPDKALSKRACLIDDDIIESVKADLRKIGISACFQSSEWEQQLTPLYQIVLYAGKKAYSSCVTHSLDKTRVGVALAAIALPTDASSALTRKIYGESGMGNEELGIRKSSLLTARVTSLPASILAQSLGLGGGSFTLDAACASSLYAVKLACDELQSYRADAMLAGGVSMPECLYTQVGFSQLRALSPSGRCAPFDENADGLVVGEGAGIVMLKRLDDALKVGDTIYGIIRGIGISNDMRGNLLAPDMEGQIRAMKMAYESDGLSPADIDLIECHGTGTPMGDMVELRSMRTFWGESGWKQGQCAIGSVKSMIGHLLTGAGAAGLIKTLLGLHHKVLPPSLNFTRASKKSPLNNSPFRVQTEPAEWKKRDADRPRRAAVSAFGFGGINAHLLIEEFSIPNSQFFIPNSSFLIPNSQVAIVGMDAAIGSLASLREFQEAIFNGKSAIGKRPEHRWKGADEIAEKYLKGRGNYGAFMEDVSLFIGEFHIPPNEIPDILPQQLLMLKVCAKAMNNAGLPLREERPRMGVLIGMEFDMEATNFHLRWNLFNEVKKWSTRKPCTPSRLEALRDSFGPPLTAPRTVGALGGIVASRIAREFCFGGPSFGVSDEANSGIKAMEIAIRSLQQHETDAVLVGAIELGGDLRNMIITDAIRPFSQRDEICPFAQSADGTLQGEGAVALVLKRLDQAIKDRDRIYAVVKGIGKASVPLVQARDSNQQQQLKDTYTLSLKRAFDDANIPPSSVSYIETHGSGDPLEDKTEIDSLCEFFKTSEVSSDARSEVSSDARSGLSNPEQYAIGSVKSNIGHTGATAGLVSVVKSALSLYQEIIPPLRNAESASLFSSLTSHSFHLPVYPQFWVRNRKEGPRRACVSSITRDGNCSHVILEGFEYSSANQIPEQVIHERKRPAGSKPFGLFVVEGNTKDELIKGLDALQAFVSGSPQSSVEETARDWYLKSGVQKLHFCTPYAVSLVISGAQKLHFCDSIEKWIIQAKQAVLSDTPKKITGTEGICYSPNPLIQCDLQPATCNQIAFVFPGSGNHYVGMGRDIGVQWTEILRQMDADIAELKTELIPECYVPWRASWNPGWEKEAHEKIISDPLHMIFGQVVYGGIIANLVKEFEIKPSAVIGYSLGESAGLFATGAWQDRGEMLRRMRATNLFSTELAGPCNAARKAWNIPSDEEVDWRAAVVNRPADQVKKIIQDVSFTRLLIINTPEECVIGGRKNQIEAVIRQLRCDAFFLEGVVTVHCDAAIPEAEAYRNLHLFHTTPPEGVRFYSCALGRSHELTRESAADSILRQALYGFDFPATIHQAYEDGVRIFLEMGPQASCTRMIHRILDSKPHLAVSADVRGEDSYLTLLKFLGALITERVPVNLNKLYEEESGIRNQESESMNNKKVVTVLIGGEKPCYQDLQDDQDLQDLQDYRDYRDYRDLQHYHNNLEQKHPVNPDNLANPDHPDHPDNPDHPVLSLIKSLTKNIEATADAHKMFLDFSNELTRNYGKTFTFQTQLLESQIQNPSLDQTNVQSETLYSPSLSEANSPQYAFDRNMCMEFAIGSVGKVLGPEFAIVDTYKARVRLPDEPLMLVDRILSVEGEKGSLSSGRVVTEHDVLPGIWYLDGGKAPVCISVEAGQADLFLCSYLGIDLAVKGKRSYRLLDATIYFHRGLPEEGDTIRYEIEIEKFVRQGETYLFFFNFEGFIRDKHLITMKNGCAGFFTEKEVENSGGIILTEEDKKPVPGLRLRSAKKDFRELVPVDVETYNEQQVQELRKGNLSGCFGSLFDGIHIAESLRLPGGRMTLIDRILKLDPNGGRYGIGMIQAEADIHPDDWFLTCHFVDDMVMPGTLMYECCAHTLRIFLQRIGWIKVTERSRGKVTERSRGRVTERSRSRVTERSRSRVTERSRSREKSGVCYEPVIGMKSILKCRGPVTPKTKHVIYEVEIKEIGYAPEPYVIADAHMYADGNEIVMFKDMSMQMSNITRDEIESFWKARGKKQEVRGHAEKMLTRQPIFDRDKILAFSIGKPSEAFGEPYKIFDTERIIARLPGPPYFFMDRVVSIEPEQWVLKSGGWIEAEYDVPPGEWYFTADRSGIMPFCIILEIALQPCGWLAAYAGSALRSKNNLKFRNLGGSAVLCKNLQGFQSLEGLTTLTMRARMTKVSEAADMIIENFDMQILQGDHMLYQGDTYFGFFTKEALATQVGIHGAKEDAYKPAPEELARSRSYIFEDEEPFTPDDALQKYNSVNSLHRNFCTPFPAKAIRMIDKVEIYVPDGGPFGLGFIRGTKIVDPDEWFFKAHFYQDPVCPGSLGIESFLQLLRFIAFDRWNHLADTHRLELVTDKPHKWMYRGQIIQKNKKVEVDAVITAIQDEPVPTLFANGYLKVDGLFIYKMEDFGIRLVPKQA